MELSGIDDDPKPQRVVKLPQWLQSLYTQWTERNQRLPVTQALTFNDYVANKDDLTKLELMKISCTKHDEGMANMRCFQARVTNELQERFESEIAALKQNFASELAALRLEVLGKLKEPRTQAAFDAVRLLLHTFNKRNYKRKERGGEVSKWGEKNEYDIIYNRASLEAWLDSKYAKDVKLNRDVIETFSVCVVRGELRTISKKFKGGVGIEAFWVPDKKYDEAGFTESSSYESTEAFLSDPRREYALDGVKWVPPLSNKRPVEVSRKKAP